MTLQQGFCDGDTKDLLALKSVKVRRGRCPKLRDVIYHLWLTTNGIMQRSGFILTFPLGFQLLRFFLPRFSAMIILYVSWCWKVIFETQTFFNNQFCIAHYKNKIIQKNVSKIFICSMLQIEPKLMLNKSYLFYFFVGVQHFSKNISKKRWQDDAVEVPYHNLVFPLKMDWIVTNVENLWSLQPFINMIIENVDGQQKRLRNLKFENVFFVTDHFTTICIITNF